VWLSTAVLEADEDGPILTLATAFSADFIRSRFSLELARAANAAGLVRLPELRGRSGQ